MSGTTTPASSVSLAGPDTDGAGWNDGWHFRPRPVFLHSHAYEVLLRELRHYVSDLVPGRSFLIAGHRGAGKTSLVTRAVEDLRDDIVRAALKTPPRATGPTGRAVGLQRPFLVKLHGASLVSSTQASANQTVQWKGGAAPSSNHSAEQALQQITVALYRALAREVAEAFAMHARNIDFAHSLNRAAGDRTPASELPEVAGQVTLDLDLAPDIAALRLAWGRLNRLASGVLWPFPVGTALADGGLRDRGIREILALATANQAFQVCIGTIKDERTRKDAASSEGAVKAEGKADAAAIGNRLLGLATGVLAGGALWSSLSPAAAVSAGVGAGLLSTLTLGWSGARAQRAERGAEYSFILDRSIQTLERDLPLVIERIREAGLAPVFVIDELDKVPNAREVIKTIIDRLKSLTTDYGFFCFLTGRTYFEEIEQTVRTQDFPTEHTYFSHRLLVLYRPPELAAFVRRLWKAEPAGDQAAETAVWILTCHVLHHARLNTIDVMRAVSNLCDRDGRLRPTVNQVRAGPEYLVPMAIQLAIEHILRRPDLRLRIQDDPAFAQLAIDAMYMISRTWEEETDVSTNEAALRTHLEQRRGLAVDDATLAILAENVTALARLLTKFQDIMSALAAEPEFQPTPPAGQPATSQAERDRVLTLLPVLSSVQVQSPGLLVESGTDSKTFRFLIDRYGIEVRVRDQVALAGPGQGRGPDAPDEVAQELDFLDGLLAVLARHHVTLDDLVRAQVLPFSVVEARIRDAMTAIRAARAATQPPPPSDISAVLGFAATARVWSRAIVTVSALVDMIRTDARSANGREPAGAAILGVLRRTIEDLPALAAGLADTPDAQVVPEQRMEGTAAGSVRGMLILLPGSTRGTAFLGSRSWAQAMAAERRRLRRLRPDRDLHALASPAECNARWYPRFLNWFDGLPGLVEPEWAYVETVLSAAEQRPNCWLTHDLHAMSPADWSRFADAMFEDHHDPRSWIAIAGLRALGFGRDLLSRVSDTRLAHEAPMTDRLGKLLVRGTDGSITDTPQNGPRLTDSVYVVDAWPPPERSTPLLEWLVEQNAIEGMGIEDGSADIAPA